jgi:hypothetical protein
MRQVLARIGLRGILAAGAALIIIAVVGVAKIAGGSRQPGHFSAGPEISLNTDPTAGDDGAISATPTANPDERVVRDAATAFTAAWLRRDLSAAAWHMGIAKLATASLAASLDGVDPSSVPATRVTGTPVVLMRGELYAQVTITVDTGTLRLGLSKQGNQWLVDSVDWGRV